MRTTGLSIFTLIATFGSLSVAQLDGETGELIAKCALPCLLPSLLTTSCDQEDIACICNEMIDQNIQSRLTECRAESCSEEEMSRIIPAIEKVCADAGAPLPSASPVESRTPSGASSGAPEVPAPTGTEPPKEEDQPKEDDQPKRPEEPKPEETQQAPNAAVSGYGSMAWSVVGVAGVALGMAAM
ncbi:hypothetical protein M011DRAFT_486681 [Sporormia fimetaria CBS 119925]|uniref:CFEM domain-containing protein n=1 Tax=Sporormia fimetaria CBS 119925 TaxID=1340428 RepID=A0A6A6VCV5_9PLEO|nr:hypothetical protein M011DRAFT_486681 [Sporormia fimetaria CBS 119925]